ncbi:MAG: hypothetical protein ACC661_06995, partial [Verrucomicrobiales bacterium]
MKLLPLVLPMLFLASALRAEDLSVLGETPEGVLPGKQLEAYLKAEFYAQVERRLDAFEQIKTKADCEQWQRERIDFFLERIGGLPERTPLNAKTVG